MTRVILFSWLISSAAIAAEPVSFDRDVRPIFAARCVSCHGEDAQESNLRLDRKSDALRGGSHRDAIRPGRLAESRLIKYVSGQGERMPPEGEPLSATQIAVLRTWIEQGAAWPDDDGKVAELLHWSFLPVRRPVPPRVSRSTWPRNPVDAFVLARLDREGVEPAPEAERRVLLRRLSLDLLGVLPTAGETAEFLADESPHAYERLVDRLLASPHFGERWGRHWLDRARFAESSGCVVDIEYVYAWCWRDWVIRSFNRDQPFDAFTLDQIAGDLLPRATLDQRTATGFHRNAMENHEGGTDSEQERVKNVVDRTNAIGIAWLGLSVGCAECHSHKYDPITQEDFYKLFAFFNSLENRDIDGTSLSDDQLADSRRRLEAARARFLSASEFATEQHEWEMSVSRRDDDGWRLPRSVDPAGFRTSSHSFLELLADGSYQVSGRLSGEDSYEVTFSAPPEELTAVRIEALPSAFRFERGPGRNTTGRFVITDVGLKAEFPDQPKPWRAVAIGDAATDYCQDGYRVADTLDEKDDTGWASEQRGVPHAAVFFPKDGTATRGAARLRVAIDMDAPDGRQLVRFRVTYSTRPRDQLETRPVPDVVRKLVQLPAADRTPEQAALIKRYFLSMTAPQSAALAEWNRELFAYAGAIGETANPTVCERDEPRPTFVHIRGDFRRPGKPVQPGMLAAFHGPSNVAVRNASTNAVDGRELPRPSPAHASTRIDLGRWLASPDNPLTARVAVNDIWQHLFGAGLVRTPNDFGRQGDPPSHQELLDWLADEFVRVGWSRKQLLRTIVSSSTYRQSSVVRPELVERDPKNMWLARQNRFRLDAEIIRDTSLQVAGLLGDRIGGASFRPDGEQPAAWRHGQQPPPANDVYRRAVYALSQRTTPFETLQAFDRPTGDNACPERHRTNTPLQSLTMLNEATFVAAYSALARRLTNEFADDDLAIQAVFEYCFSRSPSVVEARIVRGLLDAATADFRADPEGAAKLVRENTASAVNVRLAAWLVATRTLLNSDEFVSRP